VLDQLGDPIGPVEERELAVGMEVYEGHAIRVTLPGVQRDTRGVVRNVMKEAAGAPDAGHRQTIR